MSSNEETARKIIARTAHDAARLHKLYRDSTPHLRNAMRDEILASFIREGYAPHELFGYLTIIQGTDIWIEFLDQVRNDLVVRRYMNAALSRVTLEEGF